MQKEIMRAQAVDRAAGLTQRNVVANLLQGDANPRASFFGGKDAAKSLNFAASLDNHLSGKIDLSDDFTDGNVNNTSVPNRGGSGWDGLRGAFAAGSFGSSDKAKLCSPMAAALRNVVMEASERVGIALPAADDLSAAPQ